LDVTQDCFCAAATSLGTKMSAREKNEIAATIKNIIKKFLYLDK
jgi:hypothetical protein